MSDLPGSIASGFRALEENPFVVDQRDDGRITELDDLDGVGPQTVRKLNDAGIREPSDLYGYSLDEIAAIEGIGPKTAAKLRQQIAQRGRRIRNRGFQDHDIEKARDDHAERSPTERRTDESFNAETALSYEKWNGNPNQYDMPGVDTIPRERRLERTREAAEVLSREGLVEDIVATPSGPKDGGVTGTASGTSARIATAQDDPESTVAHELGHLADKAGGGRANLTQELFGPVRGEPETDQQAELREEGARLASRRRRGGTMDPDWIEEKAEKGSFGGGGFDEIFADAFAEFVEEPRRARSEAPTLFQELRSEFQEETEGFWTPF